MATSQLVLDLGFLPPGVMTFPQIVGSAVEGGASLAGPTDASDSTGGGLWSYSYGQIVAGNIDQSKLRLINRIGIALAGGIRNIAVPFLVDFVQPVIIGVAPVGTPFSDLSKFSDTSEFSQAPVAGVVSGAQAVGAGTITVSVIGGTGVLECGEFFGLNHPTNGFRVYNVTDIDSQTTDGNGNNVYTVGIRPTLRDAIADQAPVTWWRPKCLMRLAPGSSIDLDVRPFWLASPSVKFIEAF